MKDYVIVKSKTINNESVPVVFQEIDPATGENEKRELSRPIMFKDFQAEMPLKWAKILVKQNPHEFSIISAKDKSPGKVVKEAIRVAGEKREGFVCEHCGVGAKSKAGLLCHIRYKHPDKWEGKKTTKKEK